MTPEIVRELFGYRDGALYWRVKRGPAHVGRIAGALGPEGYRLITAHGKVYGAHRLVFMWHHGWMPTKVDHIDSDPTNNRIENLRAATNSQNAHNARLRSDNTSGVKGVAWYKKLDKWMAYCNVNGKRKHLGYFCSLPDAARVVRQFRDEHHGKFANHGGTKC